MKVYIASHKHIDLMVPSDYQPIYAGAVKYTGERHADWAYDDSTESNISLKNPFFCELTALHWIWKNDKSDISGLVHYRRYAKSEETGLPLSKSEVEYILATHDCIVARRSYLFSKFDNRLCSVAEQYRTIHSSTDLALMERVIKRHFNAYYPAFKRCVIRNYLFPCNIIICKREILDKYCHWLFNVESILEQYIDPIKGRDSYQKRVFGFLAERLLNVFIEAHQLNIFEASVYDPAHPIEEPSYSFKTEDLRPKLTIRQSNKRPIVGNRNYSRVFDYRFYLEHYADLTYDSIPDEDTALWHFLEYGIPERRMAHPSFSIASYMSGHPELKDSCGEDPRLYLEHYLNHPKDNAHRVGFENLSLSDAEQTTAEAIECAACEKTCLGNKIKSRRLDSGFKKAELLPVID
ncbi:DUF4422 domain-containing protein [Paraeggerthella hongkongensis]|uniref:DUF4422 domain-containing protein n=1 Tax=Paraeggerthella hominis TaxID=2897351 RepID=UPI001C118561|nr:DUF4422 domain-containing protein [Paraeggerthella hongkongensis]MCD2434045.1 DUF4422 domain-containing protein [Paraeggerthella hominis]